jgi:hypothetical protein
MYFFSILFVSFGEPHVYVLAPAAVNVVASPSQISKLPVTDKTGLGLTVTFTAILFSHPYDDLPVKY